VIRTVDYYIHRLAIIGCVILAWKVHGFWMACVTLVGILAVTIATNLMLMRTGRLWPLTVNRWVWVVLAYVLVEL